jgi:hypothetical protein
MKTKSKLLGAAVLMVGITFCYFGLVRAATISVDLGTASNFAILAGTEITDSPTSTIIGDVGLSPAAGTFYSGLLSTQVTGTIYDTNGTGPVGSVSNPGLLTTAKNDLTTAFNDASGRTPVTYVATELGGTTKTTGVYSSDSTTFEITAGAGPLVLDGQGDAGAVFIFLMGAEGTGLTVGPASTVTLVNGAQACNVFWVVDTATIDTTAVFKGNILALNSISVEDGANIEGRLLAQNGAVTLINDTITKAVCVAEGVTTNTPLPTSLATTGVDSRLPLALFLAGIITLAIVFEKVSNKII